MISSLWLTHAQKYNLEKDTSIASNLIQQADDLLDDGNFETSVELLNQAIDIFSDAELWHKVVFCEVQLAKIADNFDSPDLKIKHSNNALFLADKYLSRDDLLIASAYRQKAEALMWVENLDSSNYFLNKAQPIFRSKKSWEDYGWTEVLLAVNHLNNYQLDSCEKHLDHVSDLLKNESLLKSDFEDLQNTLFDLRGVTYEFLGDFNKAAENLKEALDINLKIQNKSKIDSGFISNQFNTLGSIYFSKGDYLRAKDNFLQAINFDQKSILDPNLLNNIGHQYLNLKKYDRAIAYFEKSKNASIQLLANESIQKRTTSKNLTESLNNLCSCYRALGESDKALKQCQIAEEQSKGFKNYITWLIMGNIYFEKGQAKEAMIHLNKALKDINKIDKGVQDKILIQSKIFHLLGQTELLNQNLQNGLYYFQKSLIENHRDFNDSLIMENNPSLNGIYEPIYFLETISAKANTQTSISRDTSALIPALKTYQLTVQWIDSLKASYVLESSQIDWNAEFKPIYEEAINVAYTLYQKTYDSKYLEIAFGFSEKSRSSILLEQLKSKKGKFNAGIPDSILQKSKDLRLDIVFYNQELSKAKENDEKAKIDLYQSYVSQNRLELTALVEMMEKDYPKFYSAKYAPGQITIKKVQQELLRDNSAMLEYFVGESKTYVFVITKNRSTLITLENVKELRSDVGDFLVLLQDVDNFRINARKGIKNFNKRSTNLYTQLLERPLSEISQSVEHLIIVPDGIINTLSFEALTEKDILSSTIDFAELPFLIYKYQFQYTFSAQLLFENKERISSLKPNNHCLGFAPSFHSNNPVELSGNFNALRNTTENLAGTAIEISQISNFVNGDYNIGNMATERRFKEESSKYGILHLATHGTVDLEDPNYNHLKFSNNAGDYNEDNLLYQYEIANMDLNAQLVVLSACETGLGKYEKGEGVFSLARSFMYAGVPSVVMSLWRVSDASTSQLMPYFYENLSKDKSKVTALRDAKLSYLETADLTMRHPFYWSAFVIIGDGASLKASNSNYVNWVVGAVFLFFVGWFIWNRKSSLFRESS